ncbi:MAG: VacJ family lipoprotein [Opitutales bacterium]
MALSLLAVTQPGCASRPGATSTNDPLEPLNRVLFGINGAIDFLILKPASDLYRFITPPILQEAITNFSRNLQEPVIALNQALQGKGEKSLNDLTRFFVNTSLGVGGLIEVAQGMGYPKHDEDFGQTFASYGVPSGPYLFLPIFGPMTFRQIPDRAADGTSRNLLINALTDFFTPTNAIFLVNERSNAEPRLQRVREAVDPYTFIREAYLQRRVFLIHDGDPPIEAVDDLSIDLSFEDGEDFFEDEPVSPEIPLEQTVPLESVQPAAEDERGTESPEASSGGNAVEPQASEGSSSRLEERAQGSTTQAWPLGRHVPLH